MSETLPWGSWGRAMRRPGLAVSVEGPGVKGPQSQVQE